MPVPPLAGLLLLYSILQDTAAGTADYDERFPIELTGEISDDADGSALMEALDWIRLHPYDLNSITVEELVSIPCVSLSGALAIQAFREKGGRFRSARDLQTIPGGGEALYTALAPFVRASGNPRSPGSARRVLFRARALSGSPSGGSSPGSQLKFTSRLVLEPYAGLEAGAMFAKGAGERTEDALISLYAVLHGLGCMKEILAGDYEVESGQGLIFWRGPTAVRSLWGLRGAAGLVLVPHRSTDESRFLRGLAIESGISENLRGAIWYSDRSYGAYVDTGGEATGFFRGEYSTAGSLARKDALRERLIGSRVEYNSPGVITAGFTGYRSWFDRSFSPTDRMRLSGSRVDALGVDVTGTLGPLCLSGEYASMKGRPSAMLWSIRLDPSGSQTIMIRYRDYPPSYDNPHASAEGTGGETRNERGVTAALRLVFSPGITLGCYVEAFEHPWPSARNPLPHRGTEISISAESGLPSAGTLSIRYSRKSLYDQLSALDPLGRDVRVSGRAGEEHCRCVLVRPSVSLFSSGLVIDAARIEGADGVVSRGMLLGGEIACAPFSACALEARFCLFRAGNYAARLYEYETALPGLLSLPPLYGEGARWYVRLRCNPGEWVEIAVRYAATAKYASSSGADPVRDIPPSRVAQFGIQIDIRLP